MAVITEVPLAAPTFERADEESAGRVRRCAHRRTPVASLLPAILVAAMLVAAPFSGIADSQTAASAQPQASADQPVGFGFPGHALYLLIGAWLLLLVVGVAVLTYVASRARS